MKILRKEKYHKVERGAMNIWKALTCSVQIKSAPLKDILQYVGLFFDDIVLQTMI